MSVTAVGDPGNRVAEDFDGRPRDDVGMHGPIHRTPGCFDSPHAAIEESSSPRSLFDLAIRRLPVPAHMPPENWLMKWRRFPKGASINSIEVTVNG